MEETETKNFRMKISAVIEQIVLIIFYKFQIESDEFFLRYELPKKCTVFGVLARGKFWSEIPLFRFFSEYPIIGSKFSRVSIIREERPNGTNPFRALTCTMRHCNEKSMSSHRGYHLMGFPHFDKFS